MSTSPPPLRPVSHRLPARRRRPDGAVQLALRAAHGRRVRPAHRGHRRRAIVGRHGDGHSRRDALARPRLGRRPRSGRRRTGRTSSRSASTRYREMAEQLVRDGHAYYCYCGGSASAGGAQSAGYGETAAGDDEAAEGDTPRGESWTYDRRCSRLTPDEVAAREAAKMPRAIRFRVPRGRDDVPRSRARRHHVRQREHRGLRRAALRRPSDLSPVGGRRRHRHGDHARRARRRSHFEHAQAGAALPRVRQAAAGVRARAAHPRARQAAAEQAPRRDVGHGVLAAGVSCPRR